MSIVTELEVQADTGPEQSIEGRSQWQLTWRRLLHDKLAVTSMIVILIMVVLAIAAPVFASLVSHGVDQTFPGPGETAAGLPVAPGTHGFIIGTDGVGRDLLIRVLYGARISLFVGVLTTAIATVAGVAVGLIAGYFGGWVDSVLARFIDAVLAFPYIVLALALAARFSPSLSIIIAVISFFSWAAVARIVRGQTLSLKEKEYVEAARSLGASPWRIMSFDILPNLLAPVLVLATLLVPSAIVFESTLSFLGLGIQQPTPSWGNILADAANFYQEAWWYVVFPAAALLITTLAFNLLGDGIRDAMDPRTERIFASQRARKRARRKASPAAQPPSAS
jgi:ABC-type dipeptide/oligopeptide/nickel transport system permease subunit